MNERENISINKPNEELLNVHPTNLSSGWQLANANLPHPFPTESYAPVSSSFSSTSASLVDSLLSSIWGHSNSENLAYLVNKVPTSIADSTMVSIWKADASSLTAGMERPLDVRCNPSNSIAKGGVFLQTNSGVFTQNFSHVPTNLDFIQRASYFSYFNRENLGNVVNQYSTQEHLQYFSMHEGNQNPDITASDDPNAAKGSKDEKIELAVTEISKDACLATDGVAIDRRPRRGERENENSMKPSDERKQGTERLSSKFDDAACIAGNEDEAANSDHAMEEPLNKEKFSTKRKRTGQNVEPDQIGGWPKLAETVIEDSDMLQKEEPNPTSAALKPNTKSAKGGSQNLDGHKEDCIHIRARRGQATNSHSLAERIRREKISERMKLLQDLVPDCSKVTGKAVMLDEIINYIQSLQRQVEFLSMKLATINPRPDFNIHGLPSKDVFRTLGVKSSSIGLSPDMGMTHSQLHPFIQPRFPGIENPSDFVTRSMAASGRCKETMHKVHFHQDE